MKRTLRGLLRGLVLLTVALPVAAVQVSKETLPDQWALDGQTLALNGAGARDYGFLKIRVYVAALYLTKPERSSTAILGSTEPKALHLKFLRNVSRADTVAAWQHYFEQNCAAPCKLPQTEIDAFKLLVPESPLGDTQTYLFRADGVELLRNGKSLGTVRGAEFARLLLATWIGAAPTTPELKQALLGGRRD
jgi:hypothetical protein